MGADPPVSDQSECQRIREDTASRGAEAAGRGRQGALPRVPAEWHRRQPGRRLRQPRLREDRLPGGRGADRPVRAELRQARADVLPGGWIRGDRWRGACQRRRGRLCGCLRHMQRQHYPRRRRPGQQQRLGAGFLSGDLRHSGRRKRPQRLVLGQRRHWRGEYRAATRLQLRQCPLSIHPPPRVQSFY